jgi:4-amino-4-deoxy-L-arabinose transferase-like glycosyltransferase
MTPSPPLLGTGPTASRWASITFVLPALAVALLLRIPIAAIPLERDEGEYAYIAQRWLLGEVPYQSAFDQKPPGVFFAYLVIERFIGTSTAALHWGTQLYTLGTLVLLFLLGWRLFSPVVGCVAAVFAAFLTADKGVYGNAANTEIFMILPLVGAMLTTVRAVEGDSLGWALLTGILSAAAVLFKQVAVFDIAFYLGVVFLLGRRRWLLVAAACLGMAVGLLPVLGYFKAAGAWGDFVDCTIGYNLGYVQHQRLSDYRRAFSARFFAILETAWPVYVLAGAGLAAGYLRAPPAADLTRRARRLTAWWLSFSFLGVSTGGYFREHYFMQIIPAVAILAGLGLESLLGWISPGWLRAVLAGATCAFVLAYGVLAAPEYYLDGSPDDKCRATYELNPFPEAVVVARYVAENSDPSDEVFVYGAEPEIYYYARRKCASRYIFLYPLLTPSPSARDRQQAVLAELRARPPRFIIYVDIAYSTLEFVTAPQVLKEGLEEICDRSYSQVATVLSSTTETPMPLVPGEPSGPGRNFIRIYRRKDQKRSQNGDGLRVFEVPVPGLRSLLGGCVRRSQSARPGRGPAAARVACTFPAGVIE